MSVGELRVVIAAKVPLTPSVWQFELRAPDGGALPAFEAGAHITVDTPSGQSRSYSLAGPEVSSGAMPGASRYIIAVRRSATGRGGSTSLVDAAGVGDTLSISAPRNGFGLEPATRYVLVAGGIGITAIRAHFHELRARGITNLHLVYLTRSAEETAYFDEFTAAELDGHVTIYHRSEHGGQAFDLWPLLRDPTDSRVYCCGPEPVQEEVRALTMHWRPSTVHFENFGGVSAFGELSSPFTVTWQPTGTPLSSIEVTVPADDTLLGALRRAGAGIDSSCESGTCGTCRLRLVSGDALHRDVVLSEDERMRFIMPCVSRAESVVVVAPVGG